MLGHEASDMIQNDKGEVDLAIVVRVLLERRGWDQKALRSMLIFLNCGQYTEEYANKHFLMKHNVP
jgi:hypothetical protein